MQLISQMSDKKDDFMKVYEDLLANQEKIKELTKCYQEGNWVEM